MIPKSHRTLSTTTVRLTLALTVSALAAIAHVLAGFAHAQQTWRFDQTFQRTPLRVTSEAADGVIVLSSGKLLIYTINGGLLSGANGQRIGALIRIDPNTGAIDPTWNPDPTVLGFGFLGAAEAPDGKIYYVTKLAGEAGGGSEPALNRVIRLNVDGSRDTSFNSPVFAIGARFLAVQPDGKVIVPSGGLNLSGVPPADSIVQTVRLNTDGSIDTTFQSPNFQSTASSPPASVASGNFFDTGVFGNPVIDPQTGKIYFCGTFRFVNGQPRKGIVRCNPDGTLDTSFVPSGLPTGTAQIVARAIVLQPAGKVVIGGSNLRTAAGGSTRYALLRFNDDGSLDNSFTLYPTTDGSGVALMQGYTGPRFMAALPDAKILTSDIRVIRFLPDGAVDPSFTILDYTSPLHPFRGPVAAFRFDVSQSTGAAYLVNPGRTYTRLNGTEVGNITKLASNGTIDPQFNSPVFESENFAPDVQIGATGAVYVSGFHTDFGASANSTIARLLENGTRDASYTLDVPQPFIDRQAQSFALHPDGSAYAVYYSGAFHGGPTLNNLVRLLPTGAVDTTFRPSDELQERFGLQAFDETEFLGSQFRLRISAAPNNKVYLFPSGEAQVTLNADGNLKIARVNPDGTEDTSMPPLGFATGEVIRDSSGFLSQISTAYLHRIAETADRGFVVLASVAPFPSSNAAPYNYRLLKFRADGSKDSAFTPIAVSSTVPASFNFPQVYDPVKEQTLQPLNGVFVAADQPVTGAEVLPDGSVILSGNFRITGADATTYAFAKFTAAGTLDTSFALPSPGAENRARPSRRAIIDNVRVGRGGKLWVVGRFDTLGGSPAPGVARLNPDGTLDTSFSLTGVEYYDYTGDTADVVFANDNTAYLIGTFRQPGEEFPFAITRIEGPPVITSPLTAAATVDQQFTYQFLATGATSLSVNGLPAGLSFEPAIGAIVGTPSAAGTFTVGLVASNAVGTTTDTLIITIQPAPAAGPVIASGTAVTGRTGDRFSFQVISSGGTAASRVTAVNLPPGLTIDAASGVISGVPTTEGSFAVGLTVTDANSTHTSTVQLTVTADRTVPVIVSPDQALVSPGASFTYTIAAPTSTPDDPIIYTLVGNLPPGLSFDPATGTISGTPTVQARYEGRGKPLSGGVITNVQLFATNSQGTATKPLVFFLAPAGVVNISTRLSVQSGENVLIGGFIVTGNAPKKLIIRGMGPSLTAGGAPLAGALQDPTLQLRDGAGVLLGSNDDWRSAQEQEIIDTTIPPSNEREAAIVATLNPGFYTAIVSGKEGGTGIGLMEFYDLGTASLDTSSNAKLANISTRGLVQQNDDVMIGGFIVTGAPAKVIVRAIGPSLGQNSVAGALQDTTLDLRDGQGSLIVANDDWRTGGQEQQIIDTTVPPSNDQESAVVATLNPGPYTAIVRGKNNSTGVALVEAYVLQ